MEVVAGREEGAAATCLPSLLPRSLNRPGPGAQGLASQPAEPPPRLPLGRGHLVSIKAQPPGRPAPGG